jgi:hypothetical protein
MASNQHAATVVALATIVCKHEQLGFVSELVVQVLNWLCTTSSSFMKRVEPQLIKAKHYKKAIID